MNSGAGNLLVLALPLALLAFLFLSQRKRGRQVQEFQAGLGVGDNVVLTSGIYGRILALDTVAVTLEIAPGVQVRVDRRAVGLTQPSTATGTDGSSASETDPSPEAH
ncbi:MAG: preprotein translocase subunit YajC [Knoellia sp.]